MSIQITLPHWIETGRSNIGCVKRHIEATKTRRYNSKGHEYQGYTAISICGYGKQTDWSGVYYSTKDDVIEL